MRRNIRTLTYFVRALEIMGNGAFVRCFQILEPLENIESIKG